MTEPSQLRRECGVGGRRGLTPWRAWEEGVGGLPQGPRQRPGDWPHWAAPWGSSAPPGPHPGGFLPGCLPGLWGELSPSCRGTGGFQMLPGALRVGSHCSSGSRLCHWEASRTKSRRSERERRDWAKVTEGVRDKGKMCPWGPHPAASLNPSVLWAPPSWPRGLWC